MASVCEMNDRNEELDEMHCVLKLLAYEFAQNPDENLYEEGVQACLTFMNAWLSELRSKFRPIKNDPIDPGNHSGYCQFRDTVCPAKRTYWQWEDGSGWCPISISKMIDQFTTGSRYAITSSNGNRQSPGIHEFHVCDGGDCPKLASSLKRTFEYCLEKRGSLKTGDGDSTMQSGLYRLINSTDRRDRSEKSSHADGGQCVGDGQRADAGQHLGEGRMDIGQYANTGQRADIGHREMDADEKSVSDQVSTKSSTSRSGFMSHYAYGRACDVLTSMVESKKLLPSVVVDETQQCAGRVRELVRMYNHIRT